MSGSCVYLLSPALCSGKRARMLLNGSAAFALAVKLRTPAGATLGEAFTFMSGLYFRGKAAYAAAFADPPRGWAGALVIAPGRGLVSAEQPVTLDDLRAMADVPVDLEDARYRRPLERDAARLARSLARDGRAILLGSIATGKYLDPLLAALGDRLRFPASFVGRGDMSRGGLLLRAARAAQRLDYLPAAGATRRGPRPPKLAPTV